jgi:hypothetical protein
VHSHIDGGGDTFLLLWTAVPRSSCLLVLSSALAPAIVKAGTSCSLALLPGGCNRMVSDRRINRFAAVEVRTAGIILEPSATSPHLRPVEPIEIDSR